MWTRIDLYNMEHPEKHPEELTEKRHAKGTITMRRSATMSDVADIKTRATAALAIKRATAAVEAAVAEVALEAPPPLCQNVFLVAAKCHVHVAIQ